MPDLSRRRFSAAEWVHQIFLLAEPNSSFFHDLTSFKTAPSTTMTWTPLQSPENPDVSPFTVLLGEV
jgi:hypothetical protein